MLPRLASTVGATLHLHQQVSIDDVCKVCSFDVALANLLVFNFKVSDDACTLSDAVKQPLTAYLAPSQCCVSIQIGSVHLSHDSAACNEGCLGITGAIGVDSKLNPTAGARTANPDADLKAADSILKSQAGAEESKPHTKTSPSAGIAAQGG